ncbi:proteophosphoglycan ppg4 [Trypanosoma cruzi]|uniref:Proteophosphoglycan ppg4 n=1 Tax=Trypanosoma cruzi TaxID=5693 RepID=A0A7J6XU54_TRYCR|nr:proteophosphoglycan ppg4 [Trypanosoma cruzi]
MPHATGRNSPMMPADLYSIGRSACPLSVRHPTTNLRPAPPSATVPSITTDPLPAFPWSVSVLCANSALRGYDGTDRSLPLMLLPRTDSHEPDANDADPRSTSSAPSVSAPALSFTTTADALAATPLSNTNPCAAYTWLPDTRSTAPPDATTRALAYNAYSPPNTAASSATPPPKSSSTAPSTNTVRPPVITVTRATPNTTSTDRTSRRPNSTSTGAYGEDREPGRYTSGVGLAATSRESVTVSTDPAGNVPVSTSAPFSASTSHTDSSTGPLSSLPAALAPRNAPPPITYSTAPFSSDTFCTTIRTPSRAIHGT